MTEPGSNIIEYSVSDLAYALKRTVEDQFGFVRVRGEISGFRGVHSSGHAYFALKDENARLEAVVWRGAFSKLRFKPTEGIEVIATGKLTTFPGSSKYQIVIEALEPAGVGALMALLEERRRRLAAEGLFDASRKKPLPFLPRIIGVVTSPTGAVIRDILHRLADRFPVRVLVWPVRVQGETAAAEISAAIRGFNALPENGEVPRPDLLIVARGGGSLEDLWCFNEEEVVRAAAMSAIPLIAAVGHETDTTLIDFTADRRAPTPTGAAEMAVPVRRDLLTRLDDLSRRHHGAIERLLQQRHIRLTAAERALPRPVDMLILPRQRCDALAAALSEALRANVTVHARRFDRSSGRLSLRGLVRANRLQREHLRVVELRIARALEGLFVRHRGQFMQILSVFAAVGHKATLKRGFALVRDAKGAPIFSAAEVAPGQRLNIEFADGSVEVVVASGGPSPVLKEEKRRPAKSQGSLFE